MPWPAIVGIVVACLLLSLALGIWLGEQIGMKDRW
jgi:hypothetical protein